MFVKGHKKFANAGKPKGWKASKPSHVTEDNRFLRRMWHSKRREEIYLRLLASEDDKVVAGVARHLDERKFGKPVQPFQEREPIAIRILPFDDDSTKP